MKRKTVKWKNEFPQLLKDTSCESPINSNILDLCLFLNVNRIFL